MVLTQQAGRSGRLLLAAATHSTTATRTGGTRLASTSLSRVYYSAGAGTPCVCSSSKQQQPARSATAAAPTQPATTFSSPSQPSIM